MNRDAGIDHVFHNIGLVTYRSWHPALRALCSFIWFYFAARHYQKLMAKYPAHK